MDCGQAKITKADREENLAAGLSYGELNRRLGLSARAPGIRRTYQNLGADALAAYTAKRDPDHLPWGYDAGANKYFPMYAGKIQF